MAIGQNVNKEIQAFGVLVIVIVILSVVLLNMRLSGSVACPTSGYIYNTTTSLCQDATNSGLNESARTLFTDIGTFVSAFSEPKNWVIIVIIAIIGIALMKKFAGKKGMD